MARTSKKIKKKTFKNRQTHISNISGKHLLKQYTDSRISKKYKSLINNKKTNRAIKHIRTKTRYDTNPENTTNHIGGFLGFDLSLRWKIHNFNSIISKLNEFDKSIKKEIVTYKIQAKSFEERAKEKADLQTQFIDNYRKKVMFEIYQEDPQKSEQTKESDKITIDNSLKTIDNHLVGLGKRISQLDKETGKDSPEFTRLINSFKTKADKFLNITSKYSEQSGFYQKIKELQRAHDEVVGKDKALVSKAYLKKAREYEKHKADYNKILSLTENEIQNRREIEKEINEMIVKAEYFMGQIGTYTKGKSKKTAGVLDVAFKDIECSGGSGLLCTWAEKYKMFAKELVLIDVMCKKILSFIKEIKRSAEICVKNLLTVFESYKKEPEPDAMLRFDDDIKDIIEAFTDIDIAISTLKEEFYKQTPASRISIDYNDLIVEFNFIRTRFKVYIEMFNPDITKETQSGGDLMYGGSGRRRSQSGLSQSGRSGSGSSRHGRGSGRGRSRQVAFKNVCNNILKYGKLTNEMFYTKYEIQHFNDYLKVFEKLKQTKQDCYDTLENFQIIYDNYYKVWLFWTNLGFNLNGITPINPPNGDIITSLKHFIAISYILKHTKSPNDPANPLKWWVWDANLKNFIANFFKNNFTNFEIPRVFDQFNTNTLNEIFIEKPTPDMIQIRIKFEHVLDLITRVEEKSLPFTKHNNFFGVKEWDKSLSTTTSSTPSYTGTANVFNNYLRALKTSISLSDPSFYPDKTIAVAQAQVQGQAQAQAHTQAQTQAQTQVRAPLGVSTSDIDNGIRKIKEIKLFMETNDTFPFQDEYYDFLEQINNGLKIQKNTGINLLFQTDILKIVNELGSKINSYQSLLPYESEYYKKQIDSYTEIYLPPLLDVYNIVKTRGLSDADARRAAEEVRRLMEDNNIRSDIAVDDVLKSDAFKSKTLTISGSPVSPASVSPASVSPASVSPASVSSASVSPASVSPASVLPSYIVKKDNPKNSAENILKTTDVNLIQHVIKRISALGDYPLQLKTIKEEYAKIHKALKELVSGNNSIKNISEKLHSITQILLDLKYIEPKIVGVSVKDDKSVKLPMADWIVKSADKNFKDLQKLSITEKLRERRLKHRDIHKIYEEATYASDNEIRDILFQLVSAGDRDKIRAKITSNIEYIKKLSNVNNLTKLTKLLENSLDKGSPDQKRKACDILNELSAIIGMVDENRRQVITNAMKYYDPDASHSYCSSKNNRRDWNHNSRGRQPRGKGKWKE
jgi:hypothetical protein